MGRQQLIDSQQRQQSLYIQNPICQPVQPQLDKKAEVQRIKQQLLDYQREIEMLQKQREFNKLLKQQKLLQQQQQTREINEEEQSKKGAFHDPNEEYENHRNGEEFDEDEEGQEEEEDDEDLKRFDRRLNNNQNVHHHHQFHNQQKLFSDHLKNNQIHETAIHSKPVNYQQQQNQSNEKLFQKLYKVIDNGQILNNDDYIVDGQEYNLSTYQTHNLISKKPKKPEVKTESDVSSLINQFKLLNGQSPSTS